MTLRHALRSRRVAPYLVGVSVAGFAGISHRQHRVTTVHRLDSPYPTQLSSSLHYGTAVNQKQTPVGPSEPNRKKRGEAGLITDPETSTPETYSPGFEDDDASAWAEFSRRLNETKESLSSIDWSGIPDRVTKFVLPAWARQMPEALVKLQTELSMSPGSLAHDIWLEAADADVNPEILWDARVRIGTELCQEELRFLEHRKGHVTRSLANYLELDESAIHPDDVPVIAMCGSGGGLRALVAGASSYLSAQENGLLDCITYTAGVSGSCWLQALYFSSLAKQDYSKLLQHLKNRVNVHVAFPPPALNLLTTAPTNKFLLSGFVEKLKGDPGATFGLVDIYGLLVAARLLIPRGELQLCDRDLKLSNQRSVVESGKHPLPIYTAVRHEIPIRDEEKRVVEEGKASSEDIRERAKREAYFQWFEISPYEMFSEELSAGIPTWSIGRPFKDGRNTILDTGFALPEIRMPLLLGIFGSAFCATLSHYYKEIRPAIINLAGFHGIDSLLEQRNEDLVKMHPIEPATIPNFVTGLKEQLPPTCPDSIFNQDHLQLMDAGMSNNLPIYPLLRPGREVDIVVAFDASADIKKENWLHVVDGYARQRGISAWPVGTGWPQSSAAPSEKVEKIEEAEAASPQEAAEKVVAAREVSRKTNNSTAKAVENEGHVDPNSEDLGYCTVWVGTTQERVSGREPPPSKRIIPKDKDSQFHLMEPDAGIAVIYFPLLPNKKVPGIDPDKTDFLSTWNSVYKPENIDSVVSLARANFAEGEEQTKNTIRAVYERKKRLRLEREKTSRIEQWKRKLRKYGDQFI